MADGCEGADFGCAACLEQLSMTDDSPMTAIAERKRQIFAIEILTAVRLMIPPTRTATSITKVNTIFRTISQDEFLRKVLKLRMKLTGFPPENARGLHVLERAWRLLHWRPM